MHSTPPHEFNLLTFSSQLKTIHLETPLSSHTEQNKSLRQAFNTIQQDFNQMNQYNLYQQIKIHFGIKSKAIPTINADIYIKKKQLLWKKIQLEKQCIKRISNAKTTFDVENIQKFYQINNQSLELQERKFIYEKFQPIIYVQTQKKKKPFFGKIAQQFDRRRAVILKAMIGYQSPFFLFDKLQFKMQTKPEVYLAKKQCYQFLLNWSNPTNYFNRSTFFTGISLGCGPIYSGVDQKKYSFWTGFQKNDDKYELQFSKRQPRLYHQIDQYCKFNYHSSSNKISFKADKILKDTIKKGDIMTGNLTQSKLQFTIPFISQSQFIKAQFNHLKYYDIFWLRKYFKNEKIKNFIKFSNMETNFSIKGLLMKKPFISDLLENNEYRGFESDTHPKQSKMQINTSIKLNNYNYPLIGQFGLTPFIFIQSGLSIMDIFKTPDLFSSGGIGISFKMNKFINIQLVYALFQGQNHKQRQPANFQVRIGTFD